MADTERPSSAKQAWQKTQTSTKDAWQSTKDRSKDWFAKTGDPAMTKGLNKVGAETFWPTSLDRESDKAARILRSFCIDGFAAKDVGDDDRGDINAKDMQLFRIPQEVIRDCVGLAVFTVIRTGFLSSRTGGSGIIISKASNEQWSGPSGIVITALGIGFQAGADIYDCVCVINNKEGMESFTNRGRFTLGGEVGAAAGPIGGGAQVASELHKRQAPVLTYTKGRGLYMGVQVKGTVIVERRTENERFYGVEGVESTAILGSEVQPPVDSVVGLWETLKAVEGHQHDASKLPPAHGAPDDLELEPPQANSQKEYEELGLCPEERSNGSK